MRGGNGGEGAGPRCRHGQEPEVNLKGLLKEIKITAMLEKTRNCIRKMTKLNSVTLGRNTNDNRGDGEDLQRLRTKQETKY